MRFWGLVWDASSGLAWAGNGSLGLLGIGCNYGGTSGHADRGTSRERSNISRLKLNRQPIRDGRPGVLAEGTLSEPKNRRHRSRLRLTATKISVL